VNTKIKLSMAVPGYGSDFNVTKKQTTYVPWDLKLGVTFPGGDTDQFGNVWPIRAHGLNANGNGTLIVPGSPGALPFLFDAGWGCWTTLAQSNQQCAALNTWFGSSVNYVSFAWDFWFTAYCGSTGAINGWIFKGKDAESGKWNGPPGLPFDKALSSISLFYGTGHGPRTSSWGFVDTGTAHLGASGTVAIIVDTVAKTLKAG
jgi:hypothetical protein